MFEKEVRRYLKSNGFETFCPKAVLFDMDGVLYDSMPNHAVSWHQSMATFNLKMTPEEAYFYEGMRGVETIKLLTKKQWGREASDEEASRMYEQKSHCFKQCSPAPIMRGVHALMEKIKACGLKIVVVTGSGQKSLLEKLCLDFKGLIHPNLIVSSFDVKNGKPNPEPYLLGLQKVGIPPYEGIVVENAPLGIRAAVGAKVFTVAVNTGPLADALLQEEGANLIFPTMEAFKDEWEKIPLHYTLHAE